MKLNERQPETEDYISNYFPKKMMLKITSSEVSVKFAKSLVFMLKVIASNETIVDKLAEWVQ